MGNENKKTSSMVSTNNSSRNNSPRGSETFSQTPSSASPAPNQQLPMSHSFDHLPQFLSQSPMMSSPTPSPMPQAFGNSFMPTPSFNPLNMPNGGFLTTPITNGLSLPFAYPPMKMPTSASPMFRFNNKYDSLFEEFDFGMPRYRPTPRHYCCPNYCPQECRCPPQFPQQPQQRAHTSHRHQASHHSTHADKRHERRSADHHKHQSHQSQHPVRVVCRNA